jgi:hypothetical protein
LDEQLAGEAKGWAGERGELEGAVRGLEAQVAFLKGEGAAAQQGEWVD